MNMNLWIEKLLQTEPIEQVRALILLFTLLIVFIQLLRMLRESKKNHLLNKKLMTIQHLKDVRNDYRDSIFELEKIYPNTTKIPPIEEVNSDSIKRKHIEKVLSVVEHMAVPLNEDIYDLEIFKKMSNNFFKNLFVKYKPYIDSSRKLHGINSKYIEFEKLYKKLN